MIIMNRGGLAVGIDRSIAFFKLDVDMHDTDALLVVFLVDVCDVVGRLQAKEIFKKRMRVHRKWG